jgi:hypothetical protein
MGPAMNDSKKLTPFQGLLPNPTESDEQSSRFGHQDVHGLSIDRAEAEVIVLRYALARATFERWRPAHLFVDGGGHVVTDVEWVRGRVAALRSTLHRRRKGCAA